MLLHSLCGCGGGYGLLMDGTSLPKDFNCKDWFQGFHYFLALMTLQYY